MTHYQNILVALDLDPEDDSPVTAQATKIAEATGGKVHLIHVVEPIYNYGIPPEATTQLEYCQDEIQKSAVKKLEKIGKKYSIPKECQFAPMGLLKQTVINKAKQIKADLIVVGSHGRHGFTALFMRDTAYDMLHDSKIDVLAVHVPKELG